MPDLNDYVLAYDPEEDIVRIALVWDFNRNKSGNKTKRKYPIVYVWEVLGYEYLFRPTHWMPLPEFPK